MAKLQKQLANGTLKGAQLQKTIEGLQKQIGGEGCTAPDSA